MLMNQREQAPQCFGRQVRWRTTTDKNRIHFNDITHDPAMRLQFIV